jgi:putative ABC transport system ATP-binding protein
MFHTTSLKFSYTGQRQFSYPAIVLQQPGEPLLITGPSGSGKTTLLHLLAGLLRPTEGSVFVQQTDITRLSDRQLDRFRGRHIGLVFQRPHFVASISVGRNILLPTLWSRPDADAALRLQQLADRLSIGHLLAARPSRLSQGELQRAAIARALINQPDLVLADEPTSALDDANCQAAIGLLQQQCQLAGAQLVVVTHDSRLTQAFTQRIHLA